MIVMNAKIPTAKVIELLDGRIMEANNMIIAEAELQYTINRAKELR